MFRKPSELELIIQAARLVVATRVVTTTLLVSRLQISVREAEQIIGRLEHWRVIAPADRHRARYVLTTSQQLPAVIEDFIAHS